MNATQGAIQPSSTWVHPATEGCSSSVWSCSTPYPFQSFPIFSVQKHRLPSLCSFTSRLKNAVKGLEKREMLVGGWATETPSWTNWIKPSFKGLNSVVFQKNIPNHQVYPKNWPQAVYWDTHWLQAYIAWTKGFSPASCWPPGNVTLQLLLFQTDMEQDFGGFPTTPQVIQ